MNAPPPRLRFGDFVVDRQSGELFRGGEPLHLQQQPFRVLEALLERPGEVVTRAELVERLWGAGTFVDSEAGLNTAVAKLREALGDTGETPALVQTVPRRGYRLIATVVPVADEIPRARGRRLKLASIAALAIAALALLGFWIAQREPGRARVAVVLFDNETDRPELDRRAQALTDSTVLRLARDPRLEVIGNAAELRTARPFRDLGRISDQLHASFIVIGQLQRDGEGLRVLAHLIRGHDQAHVWIESFPFAGDAATAAAAPDTAIEATIAEAITRAVASNLE